MSTNRLCWWIIMYECRQFFFRCNNMVENKTKKNRTNNHKIQKTFMYLLIFPGANGVSASLIARFHLYSITCIECKIECNARELQRKIDKEKKKTFSFFPNGETWKCVMQLMCCCCCCYLYRLTFVSSLVLYVLFVAAVAVVEFWQLIQYHWG